MFIKRDEIQEEERILTTARVLTRASLQQWRVEQTVVHFSSIQVSRNGPFHNHKFHGATDEEYIARSFVSGQVWKDALDLTQSGESGEVERLFHYTTQLGFRNITAESKKAVEVFVLHSVTNQHVM